MEREFWSLGRREFAQGTGDSGRLPNDWATGSGAAMGKFGGGSFGGMEGVLWIENRGI